LPGRSSKPSVAPEHRSLRAGYRSLRAGHRWLRAVVCRRSPSPVRSASQVVAARRKGRSRAGALASPPRGGT
jgi:hypothetical protein